MERCENCGTALEISQERGGQGWWDNDHIEANYNQLLTEIYCPACNTIHDVYIEDMPQKKDSQE